MWLRLFLYLLLYLGCIGGGGYLLVSGVRKLLPTRLQHRLQGKRNQKLLRAHEEEKCTLCLLAVNPLHDPYDEKIGWHHQSCLEELVNDRR